MKQKAFGRMRDVYFPVCEVDRSTEWQTEIIKEQKYIKRQKHTVRKKSKLFKYVQKTEVKEQKTVMKHKIVTDTDKSTK